MNDQAKCIVCGCTDSRACDGGCSWACVAPPICSRCASRAPFDFDFDSDGSFVAGPGPDGARRIVLLENPTPEDLITALNRAFALGRRLGAALERKSLTSVGGQMANVCFNLGQESGPQLDARTRGQMFALAKQWDQLLNDLRAGKVKLPRVKRPQKSKAGAR
jgi:hypothetical protein